MILTQQEADYLLELEKQFSSDEPIVIGHFGFKLTRELVSLNGRERFHLDLYHGSISLSKYTYQTRARRAIPLVRLDIGDTLVHRNPDEELVSGSHIHLYREGYDLKYAFALIEERFTNPTDMITTLEQFAAFCAIVKLPPISSRLL